jgi:hypothetical protein
MFGKAKTLVISKPPHDFQNSDTRTTESLGGY